MITATSRMCSACRTLLPEPPEPQVCTRCSRVAVPLYTDWPPGMRRWLLGKFVAGFFAPWSTATEQYRWERLLSAVMHGRQWGTKVLPRAAALADCYAVACEEVKAWETKGSSPLY